MSVIFSAVVVGLLAWTAGCMLGELLGLVFRAPRI